MNLRRERALDRSVPPARSGAHSRRKFLLGGAAAAAAALTGLEVISLGGHFDHRSVAPATAKDAFAATLHALEGRPADTPALVHIGHSTHLLALGGKRFLTDPWFSDPAFGSLAHAAGPAVRAEAVGDLDALLITHDHPDHADPRALDRLDKRARVLVGTAELGAKLRALGYPNVDVLTPFENVMIGDVEVHAVPAIHDVPEIGFVLRRGSSSVYFAGDTGTLDHFEEIRDRFRPKTAILPIDGTRIRGEKRLVMNPEEAARAASQLGVALVVPSHAEARFVDPVASHLLSETVHNPVAALAAQLSSSRTARLVLPVAGSLVDLA